MRPKTERKERQQMNEKLGTQAMKQILNFQKDEITGSALYLYMAGRQKDAANREALLQISRAEQSHYEIWKRYTGREVSPDRLRLGLFKALRFLLGDTFAIRFSESRRARHPGPGVESDVPGRASHHCQEEAHEDMLMKCWTRALHYGLHGAGAQRRAGRVDQHHRGPHLRAGNTRLIALRHHHRRVGPLSMAASIAWPSAPMETQALKSSVHRRELVRWRCWCCPTPHLPQRLYLAAFLMMLAFVLLIILYSTTIFPSQVQNPLAAGSLRWRPSAWRRASLLLGLAAKALLGG